mmetsp:Transcript_7890/g.12169  ORF Transcript_7890/g.12169 Transcript_7890/m.12169 type:complete len:614 (+) Transcript_7890:23-1864(+)
MLSFVAYSCAVFAAAAAPLSSHANDNVISMPLIPHHVMQKRRALLEGSTYQQTVNSLYQGYGTHYVDLWVGPPPQRQTVIVDTGSAVTAFPCAECHDCGESYHTDKYFHEEESTTFQKLDCQHCSRGHCTGGSKGGQCTIGMSYQEGSSWTAYEGVDVAYTGGLHDKALVASSTDEEEEEKDENPFHANAFSFNLTFGCQTHLTGLFKTQLADGIMGMDNAATSYWKQMHSHGAIKKQVFSMCFSRQPTANRKGTQAGAMTFGGIETRLHSTPMIYAANTGGGRGFYSVRMRKMYFREGSGKVETPETIFDKSEGKIQQLDISEGALNTRGIIVDSGTTDTYMNNRIGSEFRKMFAKMTGRNYDHSVLKVPLEDILKFPTVILQLQGLEENTASGNVVGLAGDLDPANPNDVLVAVPPDHYMEYDHKKDGYVARFYVKESGGSVLGGNTMMGHDVLFDIDQKKIGWAMSDCDYGELVDKVALGEDTDQKALKQDTIDQDQMGHEQQPEVMDEDDDEGSASTVSKGKNTLKKSTETMCTTTVCQVGGIGGFFAVFLLLVVMCRRGSRKRAVADYSRLEVQMGDLDSKPYKDQVDTEEEDDIPVEDLDEEDEEEE